MRMLLPSLGLVLAMQAAGWRANPEIVQRSSAQQPGFNYDESRVGTYTLPDPLTSGGAAVGTPEAWRPRRAAILELFREHVYGRTPARLDRSRFDVIEKNTQALDGTATLERIGVGSQQAGREHRFELTLFLPNRPAGRVPVILLLNNRPATNTDPTRKEKSGFWPVEEVVARGYGIAAALQVGDFAPDDKDRFREGAIRLFEGDTQARPATPGPRSARGRAAGSRARPLARRQGGALGRTRLVCSRCGATRRSGRMTCRLSIDPSSSAGAAIACAPAHTTSRPTTGSGSSTSSRPFRDGSGCGRPVNATRGSPVLRVEIALAGSGRREAESVPRTMWYKYRLNRASQRTSG